MKKKLLLMYGIMVLAIAIIAPPANATPEQDTIDALTALENHILNNPALTDPQIAAYKATVDSNKLLFGSSSGVMAAALDLVGTYDTQVGPLWVLGSPVQSVDRYVLTDSDIEWVVCNVMQYIMDYTYTLSNVATYETTLDGKLFGSSAHFPGYVDPAAQRVTNYSIDIDASYPDTVGWTRFQEGPGFFSRRPTGTYAAPGDIITVTVPSSMVNQGYRVRVGCHSWDFETGSPGCPKNPMKRLDRVSLVYNIISTTTKVANPLGGGIYIEVPFDTAGNVETIQISNAVRSPFFSVNSITGNNTTVADWQNIERNNPAPWADFQTEKYLMNVPTDWIYALDTPDVLMADWGLAADINNELMGFPYIQGRECFYLQVDLSLRGNAYYPGWPQCNVSYNPNTSYGGLANNPLTKGPQYASSYLFHEEGHGYLFPKLPGETESAVNLAHVAIWHQGFGYDLDYAFAASRGEENNPHKTLDNTAICWMLSFNFVDEVPMEQLEKQYQLKGHAKYVDIARLFGWQVVNDYFKSFVDYYEATSIAKPFNNDTDEHILRLCIAADCDLRPLLYFWGIHPANPTSLAADIAAANLTNSTADRNTIYDEIFKFSRMVPKDNAQFQSFCLDWWGKQPSVSGYQTESEHAQQWDSYDSSSHDAIVAVINSTLATYFPGGDPIPDLTAPTPDPMTWAVVPETVASGPLDILTTATLAANNPATGLPWTPSDTYRLAFVTSGTRDAASNDIADYNAFVQGLADTAGLGNATWKVIGSTDTVDARDNTSSNTSVDGTGEAIFLVDGSTLIANDYADLWDGSIDNMLNIDENGTTGISVTPATGSTANGTARDRHLGGSDEVPSKIEYGNTTKTSAQWALIYNGAATSSYPYYALSEPMIVGGDSDSEVTMTASTATDPSGVEYYFAETSGNPGGDDSGWQDSPVYTDSGLASGTQYTYTVKVRDKSIYQNESAPSSPASVTTTGTDLTPPVPNPAAFAVAPQPASSGTTTVIAGTDFTGRNVSGPTASNITWTTNGISAPGNMTTDAPDGLFYTANAQGHFAPNRNVDNEGPWNTSVALNLTVPSIYLEEVVLDYRHFNNSGNYQTANRTVNWTVTVTGSVSGQLNSVQVLGIASLSGSETVVFNPALTLTNSESYDITIHAVGTTVGNNTGLDALTINGIVNAGDPETEIIMTATTAADASGVEYYFDETSGNPGGSDSGWQDSPTYKDSGLTPGTQYTYTVKARDKSPNQNTTTTSAPASATTEGTPPDYDPPTPNPATFASAPAAISDRAITMTATTGSDASGPVEYLFTETSGNPGGTSSGWQTSPSYTDSGLIGSTQYTYTVKMRDSLGNTGTASAGASATTYQSIYELEDGVLSGPQIASNNAGFTGTGFADYIHSTVDYAELTVNVSTAGNYNLSFRYALASGDRPLEIKVNGQVVNASLSFPATGNWTTWGYTATLPVTLNAGNNTVRATAIGYSGANVDHLLVQ